MPTWHIIQGSEGCAFAVERTCVAVVVDALRASATAAMLFEAGARELLAVREVEEAFAARRVWPDALLFGERGGLPPAGFDQGNSPRDAGVASGKRVIFTTTTGAGRLVACWGAKAALLGTTVNASAVVRAARRLGGDVVLIPAGLAGDPSFDAQEDWTAAAVIALRAKEFGALDRLGEGAAAAETWFERIRERGVLRLFQEAPHAEKLRRAGLGEDVEFCARQDLTRCVPWASGRTELGVRCVPVEHGPCAGE